MMMMMIMMMIIMIVILVTNNSKFKLIIVRFIHLPTVIPRNLSQIRVEGYSRWKEVKHVLIWSTINIMILL